MWPQALHSKKWVSSPFSSPSTPAFHSSLPPQCGHGLECRSVGCTRTPLNKGNAPAGTWFKRVFFFTWGQGAMEQFAKAACVPPACRDDGSVSCIGTRHARLWPMCNIEQSANETESFEQRRHIA